MAAEPIRTEAYHELADEFEAVRAPGLRIADAARVFATRTADLEWALWATDPDDPPSEPFDHTYAREALVKRGQAWRAARDGLMEALAAWEVMPMTPPLERNGIGPL